jgi:hypothetical protein
VSSCVPLPTPKHTDILLAIHHATHVRKAQRLGNGFQLPSSPTPYQPNPHTLRMRTGYGDPDTFTNVSFGPLPTKRYITTWFRKAITFTRAARPAKYVRGRTRLACYVGVDAYGEGPASSDDSRRRLFFLP